MKDRIRMIRKDASMTQQEFGDAIGSSRPMVTAFEAGRVVPGPAQQKLICVNFNVDPHWLETGDGEPYSGALVPKLNSVLMRNPYLLELLKQTVDSLDEEDWTAINQAARKILERGKEKGQ